MSEKDSINTFVGIIRFTAEWCGPCKVFEPVFDKVTKELGCGTMVIDIDKEPEITALHGIVGVPTIIAINEGNVVGSHVGLLPEAALKKFILEHIPTIYLFPPKD